MRRHVSKVPEPEVAHFLAVSFAKGTPERHLSTQRPALFAARRCSPREQRAQGVGGRPEGAIKLSRDDDVARLQRRQQELSLRTVRERYRPRHSGLNEEL